MVSVVVLLSVWSSFILIGTAFYGFYDDYNWSKGIFYAVNVGFNIGWNWTLDESQNSEIFSIFYLLTGFFLLTLAIVYIGEVAIEKKSTWLASYTSMRLDARQRELGLMSPSTFEEDFRAFASANYVTISFCFALVIWILVGTAWSCWTVGWTFVDGLYFALSSLTAGGMKSLPDDSPDWYYGFTGVYAAIGIPLMALSIGLIAAAIILHASYSSTFDNLIKPVSSADLRVLREIEKLSMSNTTHSVGTQPLDKIQSREGESVSQNDKINHKGRHNNNNNGNGNNSNNNNANSSSSNDNVSGGAISKSSISNHTPIDVFAYTVLVSMRLKLIDENILEEIIRRYREEYVDNKTHAASV